MVFAKLRSVRPASSHSEIRHQIQELVANQLRVDLRLVTDDAHFRDDLGADWLDRLELLTLVEEMFDSVDIVDDDAEQIEIVGDLIRYVAETKEMSCR